MRRVARLDRSMDLVRLRPAPQSASSICSACRRQTAAFTASSHQSSPTKPTYTDRLRKKIWGTESPPGQEDPYGPESPSDRKKLTILRDENQEGVAETKRPSEEYAELMKTYVPATSSEGLDSVGGFGSWWKANWDPDHQFNSFLPREKLESAADVSNALHRAVVEVLIVQQAGQPLSGPLNVGLDHTGDVRIVESSNGAELQFASEGTQRDIIASLAPQETAPTESEEDVAADRSPVDPLHPVEETESKSEPTESEEDVAADRSPIDPLKDSVVQTSVEALGKVWLQISLQDPEFKFAVLKRTMQLTGVVIADSKIQKIASVQDVLSHLITPPKPRTVVEALSLKEELHNLPNVKIFNRRVTSIDKEISVGRWKVIEKELESRGLPVTGH